MKLKESEFIAKDNLTLHIKDGQPSSNKDNAVEVKIKKGEIIPEVFIPLFLRYNRDYIFNLNILDGIPQLTKEQEEKYGVSFIRPAPKSFEKIVTNYYNQYTLEDLKIKVAKLGAVKFKDWAEKEFGESKIDKRKSADNIIVQIMDLQDEENKL